MKEISGDPGGKLIDRIDRNRSADAIEKYLRCEIDNFELDDVLFAAEDRAAFEIASQVWFFYDDCKRHKNEKSYRIQEAGESMLRRWIQFLRSDYEWPIDEPDARRKWYKLDRWPGVMLPIIWVLGLLMLPWALFEAIVLKRPRLRSAENEYWPFQSPEEWALLPVPEEKLPRGTVLDPIQP